MTHEQLMEIIQDEGKDLFGRFGLVLRVGVELQSATDDATKVLASWIELDKRYDSVTRCFAAAQQRLCFSSGDQRVFQFAIAGLYMDVWENLPMVESLLFFWDVLDPEKTHLANFPAADVSKIDWSGFPSHIDVTTWRAPLYLTRSETE